MWDTQLNMHLTSSVTPFSRVSCWEHTYAENVSGFSEIQNIRCLSCFAIPLASLAPSSLGELGRPREGLSLPNPTRRGLAPGFHACSPKVMVRSRTSESVTELRVSFHPVWPSCFSHVLRGPTPSEAFVPALDHLA